MTASVPRVTLGDRRKPLPHRVSACGLHSGPRKHAVFAGLFDITTAIGQRLWTQPTIGPSPQPLPTAYVCVSGWAISLSCVMQRVPITGTSIGFHRSRQTRRQTNPLTRRRVTARTRLAFRSGRTLSGGVGGHPARPRTGSSRARKRFTRPAIPEQTTKHCGSGEQPAKVAGGVRFRRWEQAGRRLVSFGCLTAHQVIKPAVPVFHAPAPRMACARRGGMSETSQEKVSPVRGFNGSAVLIGVRSEPRSDLNP